jgi:hypothetical protein
MTEPVPIPDVEPAVTGPELTAALGVATPDAELVSWAELAASAVNAEAFAFLGWPPDHEPGPGAGAGIHALLLVAGVELVKRRDAPFGVTGFADAGGAAIRLSRDPLESVRPALARWRYGGVVIGG